MRNSKNEGESGLSCLQHHQMPSALQRGQIEIGNTTHRNKIERQVALDMDRACRVHEVGVAPIRSRLVDAHAEISATLGVGELDEDVTDIVDALLQIGDFRRWPT